LSAPEATPIVYVEIEVSQGLRFPLSGPLKQEGASITKSKVTAEGHHRNH
jgi:hypothetical protein